MQTSVAECSEVMQTFEALPSVRITDARLAQSRARPRTGQGGAVAAVLTCNVTAHGRMKRPQGLLACMQASALAYACTSKGCWSMHSFARTGVLKCVSTKGRQATRCQRKESCAMAKVPSSGKRLESNCAPGARATSIPTKQVRARMNSRPAQKHF